MHRIVPYLSQRSLLVLLLAFLVIGETGCTRLSAPNWFQPGHLYHQRLRATHFDPYGDTDSAPEFDGIRPREFQRPRSETERAQWFTDVPAQPAFPQPNPFGAR